MNVPLFTIVSSAPDWLTATAVEREGSEDLLKYGQQLFTEAMFQGDTPKSWRGLGYAGRRAEGLRVGVRQVDQAILMASGPLAKRVAEECPLRLSRVTRFDIQVTVLVDPPVPRYATEEYLELTRQNMLAKRQRYLKLIQSSTGDTLYIGKRTSGVMLRLYDKGHDIPGAEKGSYWRYEVEFKKAYAQRSFDAWREAPSRIAWIVDQVAAEFLDRGAWVGFDARQDLSAIAVKAAPSNESTKIDWLIRCVAPVVVQLCMSGYTDQVLTALKLRQFLHPKEVSDGSK